MSEDYKIIEGNKVHKTAVINWNKVQIGKNNIFYPYSVIGEDAQHPYRKSDGKVIIGDNNIFREFTTVHLPTSANSNTTISNNCYLMVKSHIGHDCFIEDNVILSNDVNVAGNTYIMKFSQIGLSSVIHQEQVIGSYSMIGMSTVIGKKINVKPGYIYTGSPPRGIIKNNISIERNKLSKSDLLNETKRYEKIKLEWKKK